VLCAGHFVKCPAQSIGLVSYITTLKVLQPKEYYYLIVITFLKKPVLCAGHFTKCPAHNTGLVSYITTLKVLQPKK
jgi:hypothetical protein